MTTNGTLWVPAQSVEAYRNDPYWGAAKYIKPIIETEITGITLNLTDITMAENAAPVTVTASVTPEAASYRELEWSLSEDGIVEIVPVEDTTLSVQIRPLSAGSVTLTATAQDGSDVTASCNIQVKKVTGLEIGAGAGTTGGSDDNGDGGSGDGGSGDGGSGDGGSGSEPGEGGNQGGDGSNPGANTADGAYLSGNDLWLRVGQSGSITVTTTPEVDFGPQLSWSVTENNIVSMVADGMNATFTGVAQGTTTYSIRVEGNDEIAVIGNITVIAENPITSLTLNPEEVELALNALPFAFETVFEPQDATVPTFIWTSSDPLVATVDTEGNVTPVGLGTATITATAQDGTGLSATATVTVTQAIAEGFEFEFDEEVMGGFEGITLEVGQTYQFTLKPSSEDAVLPEITWTSSDEDIAYISPEGEVLAIEVGEADITASATVNGQEVTATCTVTVVPIKVKTLTLSTHELTIDNGDGEELYVSFTPGEALPSFTWSVDDETVVDMQPGAEQTYVTLKPLKPGTTTVTVEADGLSDQCEVTVTEAASIASIFADEGDAEIEVYDLAGRRVLTDRLKPGIYIIRKGAETRKVLVK